MKQALREHIEAKIINFLHDIKGPVHASQIAVHIQERREDTLQAIHRLIKNNTIKGVQDFTFLNSTGEITAYILVDAAVQQTPAGPSLPVPPSQPPPPSQRDSVS